MTSSSGAGDPRPSGVTVHPCQRALKWTADRLLATVLVLLILPLLVALATWVLVDAGWSPFFVQRRVGKNGRLFPMVKFRSMVNDAVHVGMVLGITRDPYGIVENDPRVTRSGRFLRRTGFDELPQLLNVLVGQMSLVGPRPDIPDQVRNYSAHDRRRLEVLPGITGYSQVHGRDSIPWPERIAQDIEYIDNWTLVTDLRLMWQTFGQFTRDESLPVVDLHNIAQAETGQAPGGDG
jgi:lipopolysaccharide/colanic/teichoic acid biosynthesis glycosyltransferase